MPVATTVSGQGVIAETDPLAVGVVGSNGGVPATRAVVEAADLVLFIGCRAGSVTTERWRAPAPGTPIIHIDVDPMVIGANYPTEVAICADARLALEALADAVERGARHPRQDGARRAAEAWQAKLAAFAPLAESRERPIRPEAVIAALMDAARRRRDRGGRPGHPLPLRLGALPLAAGGAALHHQPRARGSGLRAGGLDGRACGPPRRERSWRSWATARSASAAASSRRWCATRCRSPRIVFSNASFGWIKAGQRSGFGGRYYNVDFGRTDHAAVAAAFGVRSLARRGSRPSCPACWARRWRMTGRPWSTSSPSRWKRRRRRSRSGWRERGSRKTVAIVGAGIVGVSTALWLQRAGHEVVADRPRRPGRGDEPRQRRRAGLVLGRAGHRAGADRQGAADALRPQPAAVPALELPAAADAVAGALHAATPTRATPGASRRPSHRLDRRQPGRPSGAGRGDRGRALPARRRTTSSSTARRAAYEADAFRMGHPARARLRMGRDGGGRTARLRSGLRSSRPVSACASADMATSPTPARYVKALAAHVEASGGRLVRARVDDLVRTGGRVTGVRADGETIRLRRGGDRDRRVVEAAGRARWASTCRSRPSAATTSSCGSRRRCRARPP